MSIGTRIRAARKAQGLTQEALARRADMSLNGLTQLEKGLRTDPHYSTLSKVAAGLGMSVAELVGEEPAPLAQAPLWSGQQSSEGEHISLEVSDEIGTTDKEYVLIDPSVLTALLKAEGLSGDRVGHLITRATKATNKA